PAAASISTTRARCESRDFPRVSLALVRRTAISAWQSLVLECGRAQGLARGHGWRGPRGFTWACGTRCRSPEGTRLEVAMPGHSAPLARCAAAEDRGNPVLRARHGGCSFTQRRRRRGWTCRRPELTTWRRRGQ